MEITTEQYKNMARLAIFTWVMYAGLVMI